MAAAHRDINIHPPHLFHRHVRHRHVLLIGGAERKLAADHRIMQIDEGHASLLPHRADKGDGHGCRNVERLDQNKLAAPDTRREADELTGELVVTGIPHDHRT